MDNPANFMDGLIQAMLLRSVGSAAGESTIQEQWNQIIESRFSVRWRQLVGAIVGGLLCFGGLLLVGLPLSLSDAVSSVWDALLVGCGAALAGVVFWGGVEATLRDYPAPRRWVVTGIGAMLILAGICLAALRLGDMLWWHPLSIVAGLCIAGPSAIFVFNQLSDLADPGGMRSAFERQIQPLLDQWMQRQAPPKIIERPLIPWRHGNRQDWLTHQAESESVIDIPASEDLTLADFLKEAISRGLGRRRWIQKGKAPFICPTTRERVTRPTYDRMIEMMERLGYIERGGDGEATRWLVEPAEAYDDWASRIEDEWGDYLEVSGE